MNKWNMINSLFALINIVVATYLFITCFGSSSNIDGIALHLSILTACITFVTIILAVAGIVGYSGIKEHAKTAAQEKAEEVANRAVADFISSQAPQSNNFTAQSANINTDSYNPTSQEVTGGTI